MLAAGEERRWEAGASSFLVEVTARAVEGKGSLGLCVLGAAGPLLRLPVRLEDAQPLRLEVNGRRVKIGKKCYGIDGTAAGVALAARGKAIELTGFALTVGWEDLFVEPGDPAALGWELLDEHGQWVIEDLELSAFCEAPSWLAREAGAEAYELVVNARLLEGIGDSDDAFGIAPALGPGGEGPRLLLERRDGGGWALASGPSEHIFPLPAPFDPFQYQQLRFRRLGRTVECSWEGAPLGTLQAPPGPARVALGARGAAWFDAVRVTAIPGEN